MNPGIEPFVWAATALLALVAVAFIGASLLPDFLLRERSPAPPRGIRAPVTDGRVFCPAERAEIDLDGCIGCPQLRGFNARGSFVVCAVRNQPSRSTFGEV